MKRQLLRISAACLVIGWSTGALAADNPAGAAESKPTLTPATQPAAGPRAKSPEIHADRSVTVRLQAPKATVVTCEGILGRFPMTKGDGGVWSVTFGPLEPDVYEYGFSVDGLRIGDPVNPAAKTPTVSFLPVPGDPPALWELKNVPHGKVQFHWYHSKSLGVDRRVHVYTPPGYDTASDAKYPVLYLLHGSGDDDAGWVNIGRADLIFDNLLAEGKMKPMVVVMPEGHTPLNPTVPPFTPIPAAAPPAAPADPATVKPNALTPQVAPAPVALDRNSAFMADLMTDVLPLVESSYRVKTDPAHRAVSGLSMGGGQSLQLSMKYPDKFAYVALMSAGFRGAEDLDRMYPEVAAGKLKDAQPFKLYWIGCGSKDRLLGMNKTLDAWLTAHGVKHEFHESKGGHEWPVWRRNLITIAPMLFTE